MTTKEQIKQAVLDSLKKNPDYTFSEIISELEKSGVSVNGDRAFYLQENVIIWKNTTSDFNNAIAELEKEDKIELQPLPKNEAVFVYLYGGKIPDLPIAERPGKYSEPHWIPTIIKAVAQPLTNVQQRKAGVNSGH